MLNESKVLLTRSLLSSFNFFSKIYKLKKLNKKIKRAYFYKWMKGIWKNKPGWVITRSYCVNRLYWYFSKKGFVTKRFKTKSKPELLLYKNGCFYKIDSVVIDINKTFKEIYSIYEMKKNYKYFW